jgi:hypothetical protein
VLPAAVCSNLCLIIAWASHGVHLTALPVWFHTSDDICHAPTGASQRVGRLRSRCGPEAARGVCCCATIRPVLAWPHGGCCGMCFPGIGVQLCTIRPVLAWPHGGCCGMCRTREPVSVGLYPVMLALRRVISSWQLAPRRLVRPRSPRGVAAVASREVQGLFGLSPSASSSRHTWSAARWPACSAGVSPLCTSVPSTPPVARGPRF